MARRFHTRVTRAAAVAAALCGLSAPAQADLQICSRMSYVVEAALGIEEKGAVATHGWFRDHKDCTGKGLTASGFASIELGGRGGTTVRLR